MQTFATVREAKDFLISRLVTEAQRTHTPLSELEVRMMSFSEVEGSLDFEKLNNEFEQKYDNAEYEQKIGNLARSLRIQLKQTDPEELRSWNEASRTLRREDHYLAVLIGSHTADPPDSIFLDRLKLFGLAFVVVLAITLATFAWASFSAK